MKQEMQLLTSSEEDNRIKYKFRRDYFSNISTDDRAYWLGFLFADGSISHKYITLCLSIKDINHLEKLKTALDFNGTLYIINKERLHKLHGLVKDEFARLTLCSTQMASDLVDKGCFPRKSFDLKFPTFDKVPEIIMRDFIRGFFDGNGSLYGQVEKNKKYIRWQLNITSSNEFIRVLAIYLQNLNLLSNISVRSCQNRKLSVLEIRRKADVLKFGDYLYKNANVFLDRKYQKYLQMRIDYVAVNGNSGIV